MKFFIKPDQRQPLTWRLAGVGQQKPVKLILPGPNLRMWLVLPLASELRLARA
jgi:hypothetical protein